MKLSSIHIVIGIDPRYHGQESLRLPTLTYHDAHSLSTADQDAVCDPLLRAPGEGAERLRNLRCGQARVIAASLQPGQRDLPYTA